MRAEPLTQEQIHDVVKLASVLTSVPNEKRPYVSVALSAFMAGMGVNHTLCARMAKDVSPVPDADDRPGT